MHFFEVLIHQNVGNDVIKEKTTFAWPDHCRRLVCHLVALILLKSVEKPFVAIFRG